MNAQWTWFFDCLAWNNPKRINIPLKSNNQSDCYFSGSGVTSENNKTLRRALTNISSSINVYNNPDILIYE